MFEEVIVFWSVYNIDMLLFIGCVIIDIFVCWDVNIFFGEVWVFGVVDVLCEKVELVIDDFGELVFI